MKTLSDISERIVSGGTPSRSIPEYYDGGTIPWIKTGETKNTFIFDTEEKITEAALENSSAKLIPKNTIVVAMYGDGGTAGQAAIAKLQACTNQACCNLIIDPDKASYIYVYYYLTASYNNLVALKLGGSQQNLNAATIKRFPIRLPDIETQQKIAAILTAYDDLIENNRQRIALLEKITEEIYREWFVRLRFPGHEHTRVHKGVPEGWERPSIQAVASLVKRGISPKYDDDSALFVLNQKCIRNGSISFEPARSHLTNVPNEKEIQLFDTLINSTGVGTLGRTAIVDFQREHVTVDSHVTICRANPQCIEPLYFAFTIKLMTVVFENLAAGATGQTELSATLVKGLEIFQPPLGLQQQFAQSVKPTVMLKRSLAEENDKLTSSRDLLLNRLISGKLRVDDLDIQFPPSMQEEAA